MKASTFTKLELFHICFRTVQNSHFAEHQFLQSTLFAGCFRDARKILEKCLPLNLFLVKMQPAETYIP